MLMGSFKFHAMCLVLLVVLGSVSGACAVALENKSGHGKVIYVSKGDTDMNDGLTLQAP
jgi:hypothetical protein